MNQLMPATFDAPLVALSFLIAFIGAFVTLTASACIVRGRQQVSLFNAVAAGLALGGVGVWAMHFVGMLALKVNMGVSYSLPETAVSFVAAVAGSSAALLWVARKPGSTPRLLGAGALLGLGVGVMHYLGMYGMRFAGYIDWSLGIGALSLLIAVAAATAALWLAFRVRTLAARAAASGVMAAAVCAMHYTGMAAAGFVCTSPNPHALPGGSWLMASFQLPGLVSVVALGAALIIFVDQMLQRLAPANQRAVVQAASSRA